MQSFSRRQHDHHPIRNPTLEILEGIMSTMITPITNEADWLELRENYITSTQSASLFGLSMPSQPTAFELWHIKRGTIDGNVVQNDRMKWGKRLEGTIAEGIAEDNGFKLVPIKAFVHDDTDKIGSSFDYLIHYGQDGMALLEIKTVAYRDYKEKFIEDDELDFIEAPEYYEVQVQHEMEVLRGLDSFKHIDKCLLAVFVMDTREVKLLWRDYDPVMGAGIRAKVRKFWEIVRSPRA